MPKRYDWSPDELILALDLYFREPAARGNQTHRAVREFSESLNRFPIHPKYDQKGYTRTPGSVGMKLRNFSGLDPGHVGVGLANSGRRDREVWMKYANDRERLSHEARVLWQVARSGALATRHALELLGGSADEGRILTRLHRVRERSHGLVERKKKQVRAESGRLACEGCGFDFESSYGERGIGFAECHHRVPLSKLSAKTKTRADDLAIVCANCHRMIHRSEPWLAVSQVRALFRSHNPST